MAVSLNSVVGFNSKNLQERIKQQQHLSRCNYVQATAVAINGNLVVTSRRRKVGNLCLSSSSSSVSSAAEDDSEDDKAVENGGDRRATTRRSPLTARERLRAARVLSKYSEAKSPAKSEMGSNVLDAIRESDGGGKRRRRSRLPEAPTNMLDDSKRGMPKQGLTFDFPGGVDLFVILVSFLLISTIMFATTYFVWKLGAIHFNDY